PAELARRDGASRLREAGIVSSLKADLERHARLPDDGEGALGALRVEGDRLLAEDRLARARRGLDEGGVRPRRGDDDDRLDLGIVDRGLGVVGEARAEG